MGAGMTVPTGFEDIFGPQVPRSGTDELATYALASAAYRDDEVGKILEANNEWHESTVKPSRKWATIFRPNLGEAFSQAVVSRMLGVGRSPVIQSFGIEPQAVVEHCLAANRLRKERDNRLAAVMVVCGLLFLPGLLLWLLVFQLRTTVAKREGKRAPALATALLVAVGAFAVIAMIRLPFTGPLAWYVRGALVAPSSAGCWRSRSASARRRTCAPAGTLSSPAAPWAPGFPNPFPAAPATPGPSGCARRSANCATNSGRTRSSTPAARASSAWARAGGTGTSPRNWSRWPRNRRRRWAR